MPKTRNRVFSRGFKEAAVLRILAGGRVQAVGDDLEIKPQVLYRWWSSYDRYRVPALRAPGQPRAGQAVIKPIKVPPAVRARSETRGSTCHRWRHAVEWTSAPGVP